MAQKRIQNTLTFLKILVYLLAQDRSSGRYMINDVIQISKCTQPAPSSLASNVFVGSDVQSSQASTKHIRWDSP